MAPVPADNSEGVSVWLPKGAHEVAPGVFRPGPAPHGYPRTLTAYRMDVWGSVDFLRGVLAVAAMFGLSQGKAWSIDSYAPDVSGRSGGSDGECDRTACPWCGRAVAVVLDGRVCRHDNRNNSGFCKGSLCPVDADLSGSSDG